MTNESQPPPLEIEGTNLKFRPISQETIPKILNKERLEEQKSYIEQKTKQYREYVDLREVGLDDQAIWIVANIINKVRDQNIDWFTGIVGPEGVGKTTLALNLYATICKFGNRNISDTLNQTLVYDEDELLKSLSILNTENKYLPLLMDEGANILLNRESMNRERAYILKFFNVMRFLNYIVLICTPNIKFLDKNVREHRLKSVFYIPQRGVYWYYDRQQLTRMFIMEKPNKWHWIEPRFLGTYKVNKELEEITMKIKHEYIENFKEKIKTFIRKRK